MAYTTIDDPELFFQTKTYTGTGSSNSITLDGDVDMQPDWVWIKDRGRNGYNHNFYDSVRGTTKLIWPNLNNTEGTYSDSLTAFNSDGFTLGADSSNGEVNVNTQTYVSWNWKMGTSFSNDASATSIGTIDSSGSINTTAGQSIISWTGTGSAATIAHGLGAVPTMIIVKNRDQNDDWYIYNVHNGNTHSILLNSSGAKVGAYSDNWNNTTPTSSVFSVGGSHATSGGSSEKMIAYCFTDIKGYSKFGSYTGNGNADGTFVYTGFRPAWILTKKSSGTSSWILHDNKRDPVNPLDEFFTTEESDDAGDLDSFDFTSNGFKLRTSNGDRNANGETYIFMAFAESPFVNSNKVPTNAR